MTQPQRKIDVIVDGQPVSDSIIKKYDLNKEKDISYSKNQESYVSIFVGIVQRRESILVSLPKHFKHVEDFKNSNYETQKKDIRLIMDCISESTHDLQNAKYDLNKESSSDFPIDILQDMDCIMKSIVKLNQIMVVKSYGKKLLKIQ